MYPKHTENTHNSTLDYQSSKNMGKKLKHITHNSRSTSGQLGHKSISSVNKEIQIKTTMRYTVSSKMAKIFRIDNTHPWQQCGASGTAGSKCRRMKQL